jgi:acetyl-CoA carboxylase biotin carboxyl carrier protein
VVERARKWADDARRAVQAAGYGGAGSRGAQEVAVADVEAHITGTVWKIECEVGDEIEEGDTVVILESMKMEMPVEAEDPGVVKEILCEEGQAVNEGDTLVVLE